MPKVQKNMNPTRNKKATSIKKRKASKNSVNTTHKKRTSTKATTTQQRTEKKSSHKKNSASQSRAHLQQSSLTDHSKQRQNPQQHKKRRTLHELTQEFLEQETLRNTSTITLPHSQQLDINLSDEKVFLHSLIDLMRPTSSYIDREELAKINFNLKKLKILLQEKHIGKVTTAKILIMKKYSFFFQTTALKMDTKLADAISLEILLQVNRFLDTVHQKNKSKISYSKQSLGALINSYFSSYLNLLSSSSRDAFLTVLPKALELCANLPIQGKQHTAECLQNFLDTIELSSHTLPSSHINRIHFFSDKQLQFHNLRALVKTYIDSTADDDPLALYL